MRGSWALLGMSERSFRRWKKRFQAEGEAGLGDKRVGKVSNRKALDSETKLVNQLYAEKYSGFNVKPNSFWFYGYAVDRVTYYM